MVKQPRRRRWCTRYSTATSARWTCITVRRRAWRRRLPCDSMRRRRACASRSRSGDGTRRLGVRRAGEWAHGGGDLGSRDLSPTQGERVLQCARTCDRATASRPCARTRVFSTQSRLCTVRRCTELNARGNARSGFLSSCFINRCRPRPHPPSRHWLPPLRVARSRGGGLASTSPSDACFPPTALVQTPDGHKTIGELAIGDKVLAMGTRTAA